MALTRVKKSENVQKLASELESSTSAIVGTFTGLTASKDFELRKVSPRRRRQLPRRQEQARSARRPGIQDRSRASGSQRRLVRRLHLGRSRCACQGAFHLGQGQRGVHLQARHRRRQGDQRRGDRRARHHAGQGRALLEAALPDQLARAAACYRHQRHRARPRRGHQSGRRAGKVHRRRLRYPCLAAGSELRHPSPSMEEAASPGSRVCSRRSPCRRGPRCGGTRSRRRGARSYARAADRREPGV